MGDHERCKGMMPTVAIWILSSNPNLSGTCICILGPTCDEKNNIIISKVKSKYCNRNHKYGAGIPNSVKEEIALDKSNGNTLL